MGSAGLPFPVPPVARWVQTGVQIRWQGWTRCRLEGSAGWTDVRQTATGALVAGQDPPGRGWWASLSLRIPLGRVDLEL